MYRESSAKSAAPAEQPAQPPISAKPPPKLPVEEKWLVNLLNEKTGAKGVLKGLVCEVIGEGKGFLSNITRVTFDWDPSSKGVEKLPKGIIIKQPTVEKIKAFPVESMREFFNEEYILSIHNSECNMYKFLRKYKPCPLPLAKVFLLERTTADPDSGMIILEDLTDAAISLAFGERATVEQVCLLAKYLGQLQAYGLNHPDYKDYIFPMIKDPSLMLRDQIPAGFEGIKADFPDKVFFTLDQVYELEREVMQGLDIYKNPEDVGLTPVVVLGDLQPNNVLWHRDANDRTSNSIAAMIDFQLAHVGNCVTDITQILNQSFNAKTRRENQQLVLDTFYKALVASYKKEGGASVSKCPITKQEVEDLYKKALCHFTVVNLSAYPMMTHMKAFLQVGDSFMEDAVDSIIAGLVDSGMKALV